MGKTPGKQNFLPRAAVRCMVTILARSVAENRTQVSFGLVLSQAIANTQFLEIPQDSHIVDHNKEDSDQTAHMRSLICVFVIRSTCVRNIYSWYGSLILPIAEAAFVNFLKKYIMEQDMLPRTSWHMSGFTHHTKNEFTSQKTVSELFNAMSMKRLIVSSSTTLWMN